MDILHSSFVICNFAYVMSYFVSFIMVLITGYIFINIFLQEHISAVKSDMGYEKNMSVLQMPKSPKVWKNCWKDRTGLLYIHVPPRVMVLSAMGLMLEVFEFLLTMRKNKSQIPGSQMHHNLCALVGVLLIFSSHYSAHSGLQVTCVHDEAQLFWLWEKPEDPNLNPTLG